MSNNFLIVYAIIINTMIGLTGTIHANNIRAKVTGFVGFFTFLPTLAIFIGVAVHVSENSTSAWWALVPFVGALIACAWTGAWAWLTDKLDA
jgi:hypothetical protein